ncbi:MAG: RNA polymerase sigma factor [Dehalococcoidia bacterium]
MAARSQQREAVTGPPEQATDTADDCELLAAARADPDAFLPLYDRYHRSVFRFCHGRLGSVEAAEDATQDVFLQALRGLPGFRGDHFAAWLFRIAQRVVAGVYRWRTRHPSASLEGAEHLRDGGQTPEEAAVQRAERAAVRASLRSLPDAQRLAIELAIAGLSDVQIAVVLARTPDAVKMLRYRGMQRLKRLWRLDVGLGGEAWEVGHDIG